MAVPIASIVLGSVKTAIKRAAVVAIKHEVRAAGVDALMNLVNKPLTDTQALLVNRLKSKPSRELRNLAAKELGVPINVLDNIVKNFKQTTKMRDISLGQNFKKLAVKKLRQVIKANTNDLLYDIFEKIAKHRDEIGDNVGENDNIFATLTSIQAALKQKIEGMINEQGGDVSETFKFDVFKYFRPPKDGYKKRNTYNLSSVLEKLSIDIEYYKEGSGGLDLTFKETGGFRKYTTYARADIINYIRDIESDVRTALK